jgi:hypothetical protein
MPPLRGNKPHIRSVYIASQGRERIRTMRTNTTIICLPVSLALVIALSCSESRPNSIDSKTKHVEFVPATSSAPASVQRIVLADAVEDWIGLLAADDLQGASRKWARDDEARKQMEKFWPTLRQCNQQYDYRKWLDSAKKADGQATFKVGGHEYGFMHVDWAQTAGRWQIQRVWMCR